MVRMKKNIILNNKDYFDGKASEFLKKLEEIEKDNQYDYDMP